MLPEICAIIRINSKFLKILLLLCIKPRGKVRQRVSRDQRDGFLGRSRPGLVVRVTDYTTEMYCVSCQVRTEFCGLVAPGYTTEMYCVSCEVRTEFMYVI
jgi:hypothetical protein